MGSKGASLGRQKRRGRLDEMGRPLLKRPFNNKKRTKGRATQVDVQDRYDELMRRMRYIKKVCKALKKDNKLLTEGNWKEMFRRYDKEELIIGPFEKTIIFQLVNS